MKILERSNGLDPTSRRPPFELPIILPTPRTVSDSIDSLPLR